MLSAIGLDDEAMLDAGEVHDDAPKGMLAAKLVGRDPSALQAGPEPAPGIRHGEAQGARLSARHGGGAQHRQTLTLPCPFRAWAPPSPAQAWARGLLALMP